MKKDVGKLEDNTIVLRRFTNCRLDRVFSYQKNKLKMLQNSFKKIQPEIIAEKRKETPICWFQPLFEEMNFLFYFDSESK